MMSFPSTAGLLLLMLLKGSVVCTEHTQQPGCLDWSEIERCFEQHGLPDGIKDLSSWTLQMWWHFLNEINVCQQPSQNQVTEAYRCVWNSYRDCQQRYAAAQDRDSVSSNLLFYWYRDSHLHATDPDLLTNAIQYICETDDEDLQCLDDPMLQSRLLSCGVVWFEQPVHVPDIKNSPTLSFVVDFKSTTCLPWKSLLQCIEHHTEQCKPKAVEFLTTMFNYLTPPVCQDGRLSEETANLHEEL